MSYRYPQPNDEISFELLGKRFLSRLWPDARLQRLGKRGERQFGIDVIDVSGIRPLRAAQFKHHESTKTMPFAELLAEVEEAKKYEHKLDQYCVLTTARKTEDLQTKLIKLNEEYRAQGLFVVTVLTWQDIEEQLDEWGEDHRDQVLHGDTGRSAPALTRIIGSAIQETLAEAGLRTPVDDELDRLKEQIDQHFFLIARQRLDQMRQNDWGKLQPKQQFKLLSLMANTFIVEGEFERAGHLLVQASALILESEKAQVTSGLADELLGRQTEAHQKANTLRTQYPANSKAWALWIRTLPREASTVEPWAEVPEYHHKDVEVAAALAMSCLTSGYFERAVTHATQVIASEPTWTEGNLCYAQAIHAHGQQLQDSGARADLLTKAEAAYTRAIELATQQQLIRVHGRARLNRGIVRDVLGDARALDDFRDASTLLKDDPEGASISLWHLAVQGKLTEAIDIARGLVTKTSSFELFFLLAVLLSDRNEGGDQREVLSWTARILANPTAPRRGEALELSLISLIGEQDWSRGLQMLDDPANQDTSRLLRLTLRAQLLHAKADGQAAADAFDQANALVSAETAPGDIRRLARLAATMKRYDDAIRLVEPIARPGVFDQDTRLLLDCAIQAKRDDVTLKICKALREAGVADQRVLGQEVSLLSRYDRRACVDAIQAYQNQHGATPHTRLWLSILGLQLKQPELVCQDVQLLPPAADADPATTGVPVTRLLVETNQIQIAVGYAYELLGRNIGDPVAHENYVAVFFGEFGELSEGKPSKLPPIEMASVATGSAVGYVEKGHNELHWVVIEEEAKCIEAFGETPVTNPLAQALLGKAVGDEFVLAPSPIQDRIGIVKHIVSKFFHRLTDCRDQFQVRFPDRQFIQSIRVRESDDQEIDFTPIIRANAQRKLHVEECVRLYKENPIPLAMLAKHVGRDVFETMEFLARSQGQTIRCCFGSVEERNQAMEVLRHSKTVVLDLTAIFTLGFLRLESVLGDFPLKPVCSETTLSKLEEIVELRTRSRSHGTSGIDDHGGLFFVEIDQAQHQAEVQRLQDLLAAIRRHVAVLACPQAAAVPPEKRALFQEALGRHGLDSLVLAQQTPESVLWSDDFVVAGLGKSEFQTNRAWTQLMLEFTVQRGTLSRAQFNEASGHLVAAAYGFTWWNVEILLAAGEKTGWTCDDSPFSSLLKQFGAETIPRPMRIRLAGETLAALHRIATLSDIRRQTIRTRVCEHLAADSHGLGNVQQLLRSLPRHFGFDVVPCADAMETVSLWLHLRG